MPGVGGGCQVLPGGSKQIIQGNLFLRLRARRKRAKEPSSSIKTWVIEGRVLPMLFLLIGRSKFLDFPYMRGSLAQLFY